MNYVSIFILDEIKDDIWDFIERSPETDFTPEEIKSYVEDLIRNGLLYHDDLTEDEDKCLHDIENAQWDLIAKYINDMEY